MYRSYEFTFAGVPSSLYGMMVCDIGSNKHSDNQFGNEANIVETRIPGRITPLHYGVRYHDNPLEFKLIFGADHYMDRYQMQEVAKWLTGYQEYQWMTIDQPDMENMELRCLIQSLTPISVAWMPVAFEANIVCDCAYAYSYEFEETISVSGSTTYRFYNDSTIQENLKPNIEILVASDCTSFTITNETTGTSTSFTGLPSGGMTIMIDNENGILTEANSLYNLYTYFNFEFFEVASGDNTLTIEGSGAVTISGRFLYNVGA